MNIDVCGVVAISSLNTTRPKAERNSEGESAADKLLQNSELHRSFNILHRIQHRFEWHNKLKVFL